MLGSISIIIIITSVIVSVTLSVASMCHDSCKQWEGDEGCSNLVLAQSCVFLLALHPNSLFLLPIVLEGENLGVLASIFILKKKKKKVKGPMRKLKTTRQRSFRQAKMR